MIWYIAAGSAAGGVARFLLGTMLQQRAGTTFPVGTLVVNLTGSLLLGFLLRWALGMPSVSPEVRAMLTTGFCGGYTTFSTFSYETMAMVEEGDWRRAALYVAASVVLSVAGAFMGMAMARTLLDVQRGG